MAPFDASAAFEAEFTGQVLPNFIPVDAIVLDPIHPEGDERARLFVHPNAVSVWEHRYAA